MIHLYHPSYDSRIRVIPPGCKQLFRPINWRSAIIVTERHDRRCRVRQAGISGDGNSLVSFMANDGESVTSNQGFSSIGGPVINDKHLDRRSLVCKGVQARY
jgi:hypothetical protein